VRIFLICLLTLMALFPRVINGQDTLPSWVPEQALLAARRQWDINIKAYNLTSLRNEFGLSSTSEALSCDLRNPYRLIRLDYENYEDDCALSRFLTTSRVAHDSAYGFGIYYGDNVIGHMCVEYEDGSWTFLEMCGYRSASRGDLFAPIFDKYPVASGYVIYREDWSRIFFVLKDSKVIGAFAAIPDIVDGHYEAIEPREYLRQKKDRHMRAKEMFRK